MSNETLTDIQISNKIILRSVYGKVGMTILIQPCKNPRTGQYPACVKPVNSNGDIILKDAERNSDNVWIKETEVFKIVDGTTFDLDDPYDKAKWEAIEHCPLIVKSRYATGSDGENLIDGTKGTSFNKGRYGVAELYVYRPGEEAVRKVTKKKLQYKAVQFILTDPKGIEGQRLMCRLLGKNMENQPTADVENFLMEIAEKDPNKIINLYTGDDITLRILFMKAQDRGIIIRKNKLYMYGDNLALGATDDAVIAYFQDPKNKHVLDLIRQETFPEMYNTTPEAASKQKKSKENKD